MLPPYFAGDPRLRPDFAPQPGWFTRDLGARIYPLRPRICWRLPIWPGFRLELSITAAKEVKHV